MFFRAESLANRRVRFQPRAAKEIAYLIDPSVEIRIVSGIRSPSKLSL